MDNVTYDKFWEALHKIISEDGPHKVKADALVRSMSNKDKTNLEELLRWLADVKP
jgi:hypothetical protein